MKYLYLAILLVISTVAESNSEIGVYYVDTNRLNVKLGPDWSASETNILYLNQKIEVFEKKGNWARISKYYSGTLEGKSGQVARWVYFDYLTKKEPVASCYMVYSDSVKVHLKPSEKSMVLNVLYKNKVVGVYKVTSKWAKISKYNNDLIKNGSEWVLLEKLTKTNENC